MNRVFCTQCGTSIAESDEYCRSCGHQLAHTEEVYYTVSALKFSILSLFTLGLYLFYWFYKNWKYIRNRDQSEISPFWRSAFSTLTCYWLLADLEAEKSGKQENTVSFRTGSRPNVMLAIMFFILVGVSWKLPDPYWLISFFGFVPLLFAVGDIRALNGPSGYHTRRNSRFTLRHYALILAGFPLVGLSVAAATGLTPPTTVVAGTDLSKRQVRIIRELAELDQSERIDYYYSDAIFSYSGDGNIVTDKRVVSYYTDEAGTKYLGAADFDQILSLHVLMGTYFETTLILACMPNNENLVLYASAQENADRRFVEAIRARLRNSARFVLEEDDNFACDQESGA